MLKYLGISNGKMADGSIPAWHGVSAKHRALALLASWALAVIVFFATRWLLADFPAVGYLPNIPWNMAALALLLATVLLERGLLRNREQ